MISKSERNMLYEICDTLIHQYSSLFTLARDRELSVHTVKQYIAKAIVLGVISDLQAEKLVSVLYYNGKKVSNIEEYYDIIFELRRQRKKLIKKYDFLKYCINHSNLSTEEKEKLEKRLLTIKAEILSYEQNTVYKRPKDKLCKVGTN